MADEKKQAQQHADQPEFAIQRIYTKDLSFESPNSPEVFKHEWKPELKLDLQTRSNQLEEDTYEVILGVTATVSSESKTAFLVEIKQAGIFTLHHFEKDQMGPILGSVCPSIIFPYARERISDVVVNGGFPQLSLAPINFDALYAQHQKQQQEQASKDEGDKK